MTLQTVLDNLTQESGLTAAPRVMWAMRQALIQLQASQDFLTDIYTMQIVDVTQDYILPWYVGTVLGVKLYNGRSLEITTKAERFQEYSLILEMLQCTERGTTPLDVQPVSDSPFTFTQSRTSNIQSTILVAGRTADTSYLEETVVTNSTNPPTTVNSFGRDVQTITKTASTNTDYDVLITDRTGAQIGMIPASMFSAPRKIFRFPMVGTMFIFHKIVIPDLLPLGWSLPDNVAMALYWKARDISTVDQQQAADPNTFSGLSRTAFRLGMDEVRGQGKSDTINWGPGIPSKQGYV